LISAFTFLLNKSIDWKFWLYMLVIGIAGAIAFFVGFFVLLLVGLIIFLVLQFSSLALVFYFVLFLIFLLFVVFLGSAIQGVLLNLSRDFLDSGKLDFGLAWNKTQPRIFISMKVEIIVGFVFTLLFVLLMLPFIFSLIDFFGSLNPVQLILLSASPETILSQLMSLLAAFLLGIILFFLIQLVIVPFSVIYRQIPFFESLGAVDSIKRAIDLAKKNYWKNFVFFLIYFFFVLVVSVVYFFVLLILVVPIATKIAWLIILATLLRVIIQVAFSLWANAISFLFNIKVYELDIEGETVKPVLKKPAVNKPVIKTLLKKPLKKLK